MAKMVMDEVFFGLGVFEDTITIVMILCLFLGIRIKYHVVNTLSFILLIAIVETIILYPTENRDVFMIIFLIVSVLFVDSKWRQAITLFLPSVTVLSLIQTSIYALVYLFTGWDNSYAHGVVSSLITLLIIFSLYVSNKHYDKNYFSFLQVLILNIVAIGLSIMLAEVQGYLVGDYSLLLIEDYTALLHNTILGICILVIVMAVYLVTIQRRFKEAKRIADEKEFLLNIEKEQMKIIISSEERLHAFKHDLIAHLNALSSYAHEGDIEKVKEYCDNLMKNSNSFKRVAYTGNTAVDGVLGQLKSLADEKGVELEIKMVIQKEKKITDYDLCILISNILKNAIEANNPGGKVEIKAWPFNENICILSSNTTTHPLSYKNGALISTKRDGKSTGYGMKNIQTVIERYEGDFQIREDGGVVCVEAIV